MALINSARDLLELARAHNTSLGKVVALAEAESQQRALDDVVEQMAVSLEVMKSAAAQGILHPRRSVGGLIGGEASMLTELRDSGKAISGAVMSRAMAIALAVSEVNASMGKIVAAPTAGACGILPGALLAAAEALDAPDTKMLDALFAASGIGLVIAKNATLSGAEGGCQAECGAATSMAAAACVELLDRTPEQCVEAAALALKNELGLVCDPIAGLVEVPCAKRNAVKVVEAIACADMARAGIKSVIPFDEIVDAMYKIGREMPVTLKETALGGLAVTPTGSRLALEIHDAQPSVECPPPVFGENKQGAR